MKRLKCGGFCSRLLFTAVKVPDKFIKNGAYFSVPLYVCLVYHLFVVANKSYCSPLLHICCLHKTLLRQFLI